LFPLPPADQPSASEGKVLQGGTPQRWTPIAWSIGIGVAYLAEVVSTRFSSSSLERLSTTEGTFLGFTLDFKHFASEALENLNPSYLLDLALLLT
jgi:hypothetical protein